MKTLILIFFLIFIIGCSNKNVSITKISSDSKQFDTLSYSNFWTAMRCGIPEMAPKFTNDKEKLEFADALSDIIKGNFASAESKYYDLINKSQNDTIIYYSRMILEQTLIYQSKWEKYFEEFKNKDISDSLEKIRLLFPAFIGNNEHLSYERNIDTIPFKLKKDLIFVILRINDKEVEFLFDTGTQFTTLSDELADELGLIPLSINKSAMQSSTNSYSDISTSIIKKLNFGNITYENKPCFITSSSNFKFKFLFYTFLSMDGVLGWDMIKNLDITIDYKARKLYVRKPVLNQNTNRNMFWLNQPIVKLKSSAGIDLLFNFDSGAQESAFYDFLLVKIKPTDLKDDSESIYGFGGSVKKDIQIIPEISFRLGEHQLNFKEIKSSFEIDGHFIKLDGVLGNDIGLKSGKLHLDAKNGIFEILE
ncbi:MAG: retroviral-like aspartic protease family protein [Candidatus Kapabacteria bacterium]|nr:retroviral-like aspartic protease family protein [Candidatus Kapabacteria bacterium]